ncbi:MAG: myxococcus cysteine-rich repeat containing protein [Pseudomonadales bacterium]
MKNSALAVVALIGVCASGSAFAYNISGTVMCDVNGNSAFDVQDTPLDGKVVTLEADFGTTVQATSGTGPAGAGSYRVDGNVGINAGTWTVSVEPGAGASVVQPPGGSHVVVMSSTNVSQSGVDFLIDDPSCRAAVCGDGNVDEGEQCDDGNLIDGDGCSANCTIESFCGDGILDAGEQCDDGNNINGDGCSAICTVERGGEGCTPGYWRQEHHFDSYPAAYPPSMLFVTAFGVDAFPGQTLAQVTRAKGGGLNALGRHAVAALLNAASADVDYDRTVESVIQSFQNAYNGVSDVEYVKNIFEALNEQSCPLN